MDMRLWFQLLCCVCWMTWRSRNFSAKAAVTSGASSCKGDLYFTGVCADFRLEDNLEQSAERVQLRGKEKFNTVFAEFGEALEMEGASRELQAESDDRARNGRMCGIALRQGRRPSQEDRVVCQLELLPQYLFSGRSKEPFVEIFGIFDGHGGEEASEMAASRLQQYLGYHFLDIINDLLNSLKSDGLMEDRTESVKSTYRKENLNVFQDKPFVKMDEKSDEELCNEEVAATNGPFWADNSQVQSFCREQSESVELEKEVFIGSTLTDLGTLAEKLMRKRKRNHTREQSSFLQTVLEEALIRSLSDIDSVFSEEAHQRGLHGGTTACVVLQAEASLLVANIGDSKAFLCESQARYMINPRHSRKHRRRLREVCDEGLCPKELTQDHRPDRGDERSRIEASGGYVTNWGGVPRVNGQLAVSRSIGDISFKEFGVIADPEVTGWMRIPSNESYLVVASDGVFEKMTTQDVCRVLYSVQTNDGTAEIWEEYAEHNSPIIMLPKEEHLQELQIDKLFDSSVKQRAHSVMNSKTRRLAEEKHMAQVMAQAVVNAALATGSMDNVAVVVVPLMAPVSEQPFSTEKEKQETTKKKKTETNIRSKETCTVDNQGHPINIFESSVEIGSPNDDMTIERKNTNDKRLALLPGSMLASDGKAHCYKLIETISRHASVPLRMTRLSEKSVMSRQGIMGTDAVLVNTFERSKAEGVRGYLEIYGEHLLCTPRLSFDEDQREVCLRPEGLSHFLALIGSVPLDSQIVWDTSGRFVDPRVFMPYSIHHHRYMLMKNFACGAFGEIWLAVRRECAQKACDTLSCRSQAHNYSSKAHMKNEQEETFVLKRILAERGQSVYLSGLREKHFGEFFLNVSTSKAAAFKQSKTFYSPDYSKGSGFGFCQWESGLLLALLGENATDQSHRKWWSEGFLGRDDPKFRSHSSADGEGDDHIVRFIESFEVLGQKELWLVFKNEGRSLSSLLYAREGGVEEEGKENGGFILVQPSEWWKWLKTTDSGRKEFRSLLRQLLLAVKTCHEHNITHRDIKPENMVVRARDAQDPRKANGIPSNDWPCHLDMRLIDFGSAIDSYTLKHLYGPSGPTWSEQTREYSPPEALLGKHWLHFHAHQAQGYDLWSIGVVMLELILGTPHVFQISSSTRLLLDRRLHGWDEDAKETAYMLRAFLEMCILVPGIPPKHDTWEDFRLVSWECTEESFMEQIKQRDPLGLGMPDIWALRLVRRLLQWYPDDRISAEDALKHPFFHPNLQANG